MVLSTLVRLAPAAPVIVVRPAASSSQVPAPFTVAPVDPTVTLARLRLTVALLVTAPEALTVVAEIATEATASTDPSVRMTGPPLNVRAPGPLTDPEMVPP